MYKQGAKVIGRYEETDGKGAVNICITKLYESGTIDPFEVLIIRYNDKTRGPSVIHRVVLDVIGSNESQGQVKGIHGERDFTEERIKDLTLKMLRPLEFCSASGQPHINMELIMKEYR